MGERTEAHRQEILDSTHEIEACYDGGEDWHLICSCGWEAWGQRSEQIARRFHAMHVLDPLVDDPRGAAGG